MALNCFQGAFFPEILWNPRENGRFLKITMSKKNGESSRELIPSVPSAHGEAQYYCDERVNELIEGEVKARRVEKASPATTQDPALRRDARVQSNKTQNDPFFLKKIYILIHFLVPPQKVITFHWQVRGQVRLLPFTKGDRDLPEFFLRKYPQTSGHSPRSI